VTAADPVLDQMMADLVAEHVAHEHPGLWCLEGADGRCAGGAPPGVLTVEQLGTRERVDRLRLARMRARRAAVSLQPESETA
jgi:hypothetical protein